MIDTVVLLLTHDTFQITQPDAFTPSAHWINQQTVRIQGIQSKQNPTAKELRNGIYKPRLTLFAQHSAADVLEPVLKIEFSVPKLLFGNNFNELHSKDFAAVITSLQQTLADMGVTVTAAALSQAPVSTIHYAKNMPLTDGSTPYHFINKIKEANVKLSLDVNQTDYRNDGHSYKWHCNAYEIVFYDKIKDLEKAKISSKRALEKDSALQLHIFDALKTRKKFELLRMEVRLNKRQKMKQLFGTLGIKTDLTFKSLFKKSIAQKVLLHYLDEIESKRSPLLDYRPSDDKALLGTLIFHNPDYTPRQILQLFGIKKALETMGMRELKGMFHGYNQRGLQRLLNETHEVRLPTVQATYITLRKHITQVKPLKI